VQDCLFDDLLDLGVGDGRLGVERVDAAALGERVEEGGRGRHGFAGGREESELVGLGLVLGLGLRLRLKLLLLMRPTRPRGATPFYTRRREGRSGQDTSSYQRNQGRHVFQTKENGEEQ
jgi:hypothetical protein